MRALYMLHSQHAINVSFAYADYLSNIWAKATIFVLEAYFTNMS